MNKKKYIAPATTTVVIENETLMAASVSDDGLSIGTGGIETGGDAGEAASKGHYSVWGDDEEE